MEKYRVYVLQETQESIDQLSEMLESSFYEIIGSTTDGGVAVKDVNSLNPDIFIIGLISSSLDGLAVLERLKNSDVKTLVVSVITNDQAVQKAISLGAEYYLTKPISKEVLLSRLDGIMNTQKSKREKSSLDEKISKIFLTVGIPPHIKGYTYLREGVKMAVKSPEIINSITKKLYPSVGERYNTSASKVERAIRHAIEVAWNKGKIENINALFGVRAYNANEKPTNGEFIALIADRMILDGE